MNILDTPTRNGNLEVRHHTAPRLARDSSPEDLRASQIEQVKAFAVEALQEHKQ